MDGTHATTGRFLSGIAHLQQSIRDILTTPIGSRVMRREYGSRLFQLMDAPMNKDTIMEIYAATAEAVMRWEPRFELIQVNLSQVLAGRLELALMGNYLPQGQRITLDAMVVA